MVARAPSRICSRVSPGGVLNSTYSTIMRLLPYSAVASRIIDYFLVELAGNGVELFLACRIGFVGDLRLEILLVVARIPCPQHIAVAGRNVIGELGEIAGVGTLRKRDSPVGVDG